MSVPDLLVPDLQRFAPALLNNLPDRVQDRQEPRLVGVLEHSDSETYGPDINIKYYSTNILVKYAIQSSPASHVRPSPPSSQYPAPTSNSSDLYCIHYYNPMQDDQRQSSWALPGTLCWYHTSQPFSYTACTVIRVNSPSSI